MSLRHRKDFLLCWDRLSNRLIVLPARTALETSNRQEAEFFPLIVRTSAPQDVSDPAFPGETASQKFVIPIVGCSDPATLRNRVFPSMDALPLDALAGFQVTLLESTTDLVAEDLSSALWSIRFDADVALDEETGPLSPWNPADAVQPDALMFSLASDGSSIEHTLDGGRPGQNAEVVTFTMVSKPHPTGEDAWGPTRLWQFQVDMRRTVGEARTNTFEIVRSKRTTLPNQTSALIAHIRFPAAKWHRERLASRTRSLQPPAFRAFPNAIEPDLVELIDWPADQPSIEFRDSSIFDLVIVLPNPSQTVIELLLNEADSTSLFEDGKAIFPMGRVLMRLGQTEWAEMVPSPTALPGYHPAGRPEETSNQLNWLFNLAVSGIRDTSLEYSTKNGLDIFAANILDRRSGSGDRPPLSLYALDRLRRRIGSQDIRQAAMFRHSGLTGFLSALQGLRQDDETYRMLSELADAPDASFSPPATALCRTLLERFINASLTEADISRFLSTVTEDISLQVSVFQICTLFGQRPGASIERLANLFCVLAHTMGRRNEAADRWPEVRAFVNTLLTLDRAPNLAKLVTIVLGDQHASQLLRWLLPKSHWSLDRFATAEPRPDWLTAERLFGAFQAVEDCLTKIRNDFNTSASLIASVWPKAPTDLKAADRGDLVNLTGMVPKSQLNALGSKPESQIQIELDALVTGWSRDTGSTHQNILGAADGLKGLLPTSYVAALLIDTVTRQEKPREVFLNGCLEAFNQRGVRNSALPSHPLNLSQLPLLGDNELLRIAKLAEIAFLLETVPPSAQTSLTDISGMFRDETGVRIFEKLLGDLQAKGSQTIGGLAAECAMRLFPGARSPLHDLLKTDDGDLPSGIQAMLLRGRYFPLRATANLIDTLENS